jgi:hypothetical protein
MVPWGRDLPRNVVTALEARTKELAARERLETMAACPDRRIVDVDLS